MKPGILRSSLIAFAVGCFLSPLSAFSAPKSITAANDVSQAEDVPRNYIIVFDEPGLMYYEGGVAGIRATSIRATGRRNLDAQSADSKAYIAHLSESHNNRIATIEGHIGRSLGNVFRYDVAFSGIGTSLTRSEVAKLSSIEGIKTISWARDREIDTYRGPEFIGAGSIWDGSAAPGGAATRGQGVLIGVIDTGINRSHPSFGVLPEECGSSAGEPKMTAYNCLSGTCKTVDDPGASCGVNGGEGTAEDCNGHGSHTASTAGGNSLLAMGPVPAPIADISGVASCAKINSYKACGNVNCGDLAIAAAINRAIFDGVDVINFSIGGGGGDDVSVWQLAGTSDRLFLDALNADILVAASAGNTRDYNPTPASDVNHRGPWLTSVAASSHDEIVSVPATLQVTGPGAVPVNLENVILMSPSTSPLQIAENSQLLVRDFPAAPAGCNADAAYPDGYFDGGTALISRGGCNFVEKVTKAVAAGATSVIVYNNAAGSISMAGLEAATVPAYSILQAQGQALVAFSATLGGAPIEAIGQPPREQGDVLADFSLRGPISPPVPDAMGTNNAFDVTKPDITGPGMDIYAAYRTPENYGFSSGTSMSSPHIAGAYGLLRAVRPEWTASEIKSALMMTAFNGGTKEDGSTPWDADDVGSGRADLSKAALSGLVMDETYGGFLAANPAAGGDPRTLNLPSVRNSNCDPDCSWTRTVRNTLPGATEWSVTAADIEGFDIEVSPASFSFNGEGIAALDSLFTNGFEEGTPEPETQEITITATPNGNVVNTIAFGEVLLAETNDRSPDLRVTVAVRQPPPPVPGCLSVEGFASNGSAFSGDPSNTVVELSIGVGNELIGFAGDVRVEGFQPSWLADAALLLSSTVDDGNGIVWRPGVGINSAGVVEASTGTILFADIPLDNVVPAPDGILRLEWFETFSDAGIDPDSIWSDLPNPQTCPGILLICSDQAACNEAVANFQP